RYLCMPVSSLARPQPRSFPTRRSSDLRIVGPTPSWTDIPFDANDFHAAGSMTWTVAEGDVMTRRYIVLEGNTMVYCLTVVNTSRSEEHTSELQSRENLVCRLLLEKKNK